MVKIDKGKVHASRQQRTMGSLGSGLQSTFRQSPVRTLPSGSKNAISIDMSGFQDTINSHADELKSAIGDLAKQDRSEFKTILGWFGVGVVAVCGLGAWVADNISEDITAVEARTDKRFDKIDTRFDHIERLLDDRLPPPRK